MKKFAILPLLALIMLASCSNDDDNVRPVPEAPVVVVNPVVDNVNYAAPAQVGSYTIEGNSNNLYRFKYENGQEIVYTQVSASSQFNGANIATVRKIEGTASDVVIPRTFRVENSDGSGFTEWQIVSVNLYTGGVSQNVKSITWPNTAYTCEKDSKYTAIDADWVRTQVAKCPGLEKLEFELGVADADPGFVSIQGAVYTKDLKQLVSVPRATKGTFTIAEGTETVQTGALDHCSQLTAITFPASVTEIQENAVLFNDNLGAINMLPVEAPVAPQYAFGHMAHTCELRIPEGSRNSYIVEKPTTEEPIAPPMPDIEDSDEVWDEYETLQAEYEEAYAAYEEEREAYLNAQGYEAFTNIKEVKF